MLGLTAFLYALDPALAAADLFRTTRNIVISHCPDALVIVLAFIIYCGMTLVTYEWSKEVASAYSWAAFHRKAVSPSIAKPVYPKR